MMLISNAAAITAETRRPRRRATALIAALAAALALAAAGSLAGPAVSADAAARPATLSGESYFHFPAWAPDRTQTQTRKIWLAAGDYSAQGFIARLANRETDRETTRIRVPASGWYRWKVNMEWDTDEGPGGYAVYSWLEDSRGNRVTAAVPDNVGIWLNDRRHFGPGGTQLDGWYEWGARLALIRRR